MPKYHGPEIPHPDHGHGLKVLVDASNVAYEGHNAGDSKPDVAQILDVRKRLDHLGFCPVFIADASLRYAVDDPKELNDLEQTGEILTSPAETQADYFLLDLSERDWLPVVSNDDYHDREKEFPHAVRDLRVPFMIVDGQVVVDQERLRRAANYAHEHENSHQYCDNSQHAPHHHHHHH